MHVNNVRNNETGADVLKRADVRARLDFDPFADRSVSGVATGSDGMFAYIAATPKKSSKSPFLIRTSTIPISARCRILWPAAGSAGPRSASYVSQQSGDSRTQFAAVGGTAYNLASQGLGHPLPLEWFTQNIRD
jgi:hypothetical protein